ncbi:hypothetical protein HDE_04050 [Halotydeus destructor]|nr:hypothetical protein HDE_04050 [Halotydeus destructor]
MEWSNVLQAPARPGTPAISAVRSSRDSARFSSIPYSDWHYEVKEIKNAPDMSDQGTPLSGGGGGSGMTGGMSGGGMGGGPQRQESQPYQPKPRQPHVYEDNGSPSLEDSQWAKSDYQVQPVNRKRDPGVMAPYKM